MGPGRAEKRGANSGARIDAAQFLLAQAQAFTGTNEFVDDICLAAVELLGDSPARA